MVPVMSVAAAATHAPDDTVAAVGGTAANATTTTTIGFVLDRASGMAFAAETVRERVAVAVPAAVVAVAVTVESGSVVANIDVFGADGSNEEETKGSSSFPP